ncbi:MAG TPA: ribonuclease P protein component [Bacteroidales bacterium]|nr:ribonuclease P protein component [Bacteroidales bacterium]
MFKTKIIVEHRCMDASFPKKEHLCKKKDFELLFSNGKSVYHSFLKAQFIFIDSENPEIKVAFAVPAKKIKKAIDRNYLKRIMREVYRKNKFLLKDSLHKKSIYITFIFLTNERVHYKQMEEVLLLLLQQIQEKYLSHTKHKE